MQIATDIMEFPIPFDKNIFLVPSFKSEFATFCCLQTCQNRNVLCVIEVHISLTTTTIAQCIKWHCRWVFLKTEKARLGLKTQPITRACCQQQSQFHGPLLCLSATNAKCSRICICGFFTTSWIERGKYFAMGPRTLPSCIFPILLMGRRYPKSTEGRFARRIQCHATALRR